jgi:hypothetical protein
MRRLGCKSSAGIGESDGREAAKACFEALSCRYVAG